MANYGIREAAGTRGCGASELTCLPLVFSYDCDQRSPVQSGNADDLAGADEAAPNGPIK
jgi:hypothetical protein